MIITFTLSLMKFSTFLINALLNISFAGEYGNLTEKVFQSSNYHSGIIISSFPFSNLQIASFINFNGNPTFQYLCLILFIGLAGTTTSNSILHTNILEKTIDIGATNIWQPSTCFNNFSVTENTPCC